MSYTYHAQETIKVPTIKETEPAYFEIYKARGVRFNREQEFDRSTLKHNKEKTGCYLDSLAEEITHRSNALKHQIYEIGRLLCDVKKLLPHGKFDSWVEKKTSFSKSTTLNFMRVYTACVGYPEVVQFFKPSALYTITGPGFPRQFRDRLFIQAYSERRANDIGRNKLLEIIHKFRRKELTMESNEVQDLLKIEKDRDFYFLYKEELVALEMILQDRLRKFEILDSKFISNPLLEDGDTNKDENFFKVSEMVKDFIADTNIMRDTINPDLYKKRKSYVNAKVTSLEAASIS
jgi:hypothetical protein